MKPGFYENISFEKYAALNAVNASALKLLERSPAHCKAYLNGPKKDTGPLRIGRAIHTKALEPDRFAIDYIVADCEARTAKTYKDAKAGYPDKEVITKAEERMLDGISKYIRTHNQAMKLLELESFNELTAIWKDEPTGMLCKARADRYILDEAGEPIIVDLKSTENASKDAFSRSIETYRYHASAAFYLDGFTELKQKEHKRFIIIAVEKEDPFAVAVYELDPDTIEEGRKKYRRLLNTYYGCQLTNVWRGYPDEIQNISIPAWGFKD